MRPGPRLIYVSGPGRAARRRVPAFASSPIQRRRKPPPYGEQNSPYVPGTKPQTPSRYTYFPKAGRLTSLDDMLPDEGHFLTLSGVEATRGWVAERRASGQKVGLVPTMGALHEGHLSLVKRAAEECEDVIVSIYVNPTQFGANEDFTTYPRSFRTDLQKLDVLNEELKARREQYKGQVRAIFNPHDSDMYPFGHQSQSRLTIDPKLAGRLEGASRPTFFAGVTTVVLKLLNIVQPDYVFFGQKDIQQLIIIQRMIDEFRIPTVLRAVRTTREADGLARSSRNIYLGERRRKLATSLRNILIAGIKAIDKAVETPPEGAKRQVFIDAALNHAINLQRGQQSLPTNQRVRFELDYLSLAHPRTMEEVNVIGEEGAIASGALILLPLEDPRDGEQLGLGDDVNPVRLIDNIVMGKASRLLGLTDRTYRPAYKNEWEQWT